eukprot:gnl/MRDRNA2_/MRDRNA2_106559_c0_seq1.p1 gnl/MRDRNA2_/MRDRNA2_106559_c0~~gnl/MRDRNA2_/MRDRNA2_106559_c0_seq1.p1  ORF type:complete len:176 (+),score=29.37 gnl/MRDRNA2_/MRDRNA2_106559_c0_seq1:124-651(+)
MYQPRYNSYTPAVGPTVVAGGAAFSHRAAVGNGMQQPMYNAPYSGGGYQPPYASMMQAPQQYTSFTPPMGLHNGVTPRVEAGYMTTPPGQGPFEFTPVGHATQQRQPAQAQWTGAPPPVGPAPAAAPEQMSEDMGTQEDPNRLPTFVKVRGLPPEHDPRIQRRERKKRPPGICGG